MKHTPQSVVNHRETLDQAAARVLIADLDVAVFVLDGQDRVTYRNAKAASLTPMAEFFPEGITQVADAGTQDRWIAALQRVRKTGESATFQCERRESDTHGSRPRRVRCLPVPDKNQPSDAVIVLIDESESGLSAPEPRDMERQLSALDDLMARIAHELNNPLDAVLRYINLALNASDGAIKPKIKDYLTQSRVGAVRMMHMISDMLNHARGTESEHTRRSLDSIVHDAVQVHADDAQRRGVSINRALRSNEQETGYGNRLFQVVSNLVRNAIDAMPEGGQLTISTRVETSDAVVTIADTGTGLPADARRLFEPFYTTKPAGQGTGLGLAICQEFVQQRGGSIEALPRPDGGSVFVVRWPLEVQSASKTPADAG